MQLYRRSRRCLSVVLPPVLGVCACEHPPPAGLTSGLTIRDSADIRIVENRAPVWDSADFWTVEAEPEFVIGGSSDILRSVDDASHLLWRITSVASLSDGRVVMLSQGGDHRVLVFERSGALSESFGREGRGPGEFSAPQHLQVLPGDTIAVWDYMFDAVSYFDPSGTLLRERPIDLGAVFAATRTSTQDPPETVHLPLPDGSFLVVVRHSNFEMPSEGEIYRIPVAYLRIESDYTVDHFGWWEGMEFLHLAPPAWIPIVPFPARSIVAAGGSPLSVYVTNGDHGDRYEVHQFSESGGLRRIFRRPVEPIPITRRELEEWIAFHKASIPQSQLVSEGWRAWEVAMSALPPRGFQPSVTDLLVDREGYLWVHDGASEWSVFDPDGRWLGTLGIPQGSIEWIGKDLILGVQRDLDSGVEAVVGYRLNRRGRS